MLTSLLLMGASWAAGVDAVLVATDGPVRPGDEVLLEVAAPGRDQPSLGVDAGELLTALEGAGAGTWRARYRAPTSAQTVRFLLSEDDFSAPLTLDVEAWPEQSGRPLRRPVLFVGSESAVELRAKRSNVMLSVGSAEGDVSLSGDQVRWQPGPDPFPRAVPVLMLSDDRNALPEAMVVSIRGRPRIPIQTEPGTSVVVDIAGRRYGPFVANRDGVARAAVEVRPGESQARLELTDPAGNQQSSSIGLGGQLRARMAAVAEMRHSGNHRSARVHLFAVDSSGRLWRGSAPKCVTSFGVEAPLTRVSQGRWTLALPITADAGLFGVRIDCGLDGQAAVSVSVSPPAPEPSELDVRISPPELTSDVPRASVRVLLLGSDGQRLPVQDVELVADLGAIQVDSKDDGVLLASYMGESAVAAGRDTITAKWRSEVGEAPTVALALEGSWPEDADFLKVRARALDSGGRPVPNQQILLSSGASALEVVSDARGWATATLPASGRAQRLRGQVGSTVSQAAIARGALGGSEPEAADLVARHTLQIFSDRIRNVYLNTLPGTVDLNDASTARIVVRLEDKTGAVVSDPSLILEASHGEVSGLRRRGDGSYEARWSPPAGPSPASVRLTARSGQNQFSTTSTDFEVVPKATRAMPAVAAGWLVGRRGLSAAFYRASGEFRLPVGASPTYARAWAAFYAEEARTGSAASLDAQIDMSVVPLGVGLSKRQQWGRVTTALGSSLVMTPYRVRAQVENELSLQRTVWASPGVEVDASVGWRLRGGEVALDLGYLLQSASDTDFGWNGPIGGVFVTAGYRLLP